MMIACGGGDPTGDVDAQTADSVPVSDAGITEASDLGSGSSPDTAQDTSPDLFATGGSDTSSDDPVAEDIAAEEAEVAEDIAAEEAEVVEDIAVEEAEVVEDIAVEEAEVQGPLEIELTWFAPGDPDPTDSGPEAGPDLDLHFMHPFAVDWFDQPFDCFWFNPDPNWGSLDPMVADDPILLLDSTDGSGPEQLEYDPMEVDTLYRIGVHVWSDHGFGPIEATIAVSLGGELIHEATVTLENQEFWEVATVHWPSGALEVLVDDQDAPLILSDYTNPFFGEP